MILLGKVDLEPDEVAVAQLVELGVRREEPVHDVAPRAPFAADVDQHVAAGRAGDAQRRVQIVRRIAGRIEVARQERRGGEDAARPCASSASAATKDRREGRKSIMGGFGIERRG